ncbi:gamma-glutamyltransferase family protein [Sphingomonas sp.]|uniref:gamma-glutamyltransferase family protein n=1 Tax=Sphingomonas sp. TaxID=28214 RepID=UPI002C290466|nr:gamma-glutamyltransferase family protein [Sphingomonas sp.]HTG38907.1 gamma-glutamyltransferase family protein [Sphingomonas sp.]
MRFFRPLTALAATVALVLPGCAPAPRAATPVAIAPAAREMFVVAANPLAAEAGMAVLRRGGSAVDAAIAVQAMLTLVEPQSSGMGGGAFMTYFDGASGDVRVYDGREVAPAGATPSMFMGADGKPIGFRQAVVSGRATGVPGAVAMLATAHRAHGKLEWSTLFGDAQHTARDGFVVTPRLGRFLTGSYPQLQAPDAQRYFTQNGGRMAAVGDRLKNPEYADFLVRLAAQGPDALYKGQTAARIVQKTRAAPLEGTMTLADLAAYKPVEREALCAPWAGYRACVPPPPSSGVGMLMLLKLLERTDIARRGPTDPQAWYLFEEASRVMFADRDRYVGDPAFARVPVQGMLDPAYLDRRAALIGDRAGPPPRFGMPAGAPMVGADSTAEPAGTTHFIVGDASGNVVSMTSTVESIFGTGRMVDGFFLNNQLTDFSFSPTEADGAPAANAVAPAKRPRSSMTPMILVDADGRFAGAIGSAGGNAILPYVGKSLVGAVMWGLPMQDALALPNLVARGSSMSGEVSKFAPGVIEGLAARGVTLRPGQGEDSGVHAVIVRDGRIDGGYDPRREGRVLVEPAR